MDRGTGGMGEEWSNTHYLCTKYLKKTREEGVRERRGCNKGRKEDLMAGSEREREGNVRAEDKHQGMKGKGMLWRGR